jgi:hypothetical protein
MWTHCARLSARGDSSRAPSVTDASSRANDGWSSTRVTRYVQSCSGLHSVPRQSSVLVIEVSVLHRSWITILVDRAWGSIGWRAAWYVVAVSGGPSNLTLRLRAMCQNICQTLRSRAPNLLAGQFIYYSSFGSSQCRWDIASAFTLSLGSHCQCAAYCVSSCGLFDSRLLTYPSYTGCLPRLASMEHNGHAHLARGSVPE